MVPHQHSSKSASLRPLAGFARPCRQLARVNLSRADNEVCRTRRMARQVPRWKQKAANIVVWCKPKLQVHYLFFSWADLCCCFVCRITWCILKKLINTPPNRGRIESMWSWTWAVACEKIVRPHALSCGHIHQSTELLLQQAEIHSYNSKAVAGQRYAKPSSHKGCDFHHFRPCNWCCTSQRKRMSCANLGACHSEGPKRLWKIFGHTHIYIYNI